jgi:hypothetical protein
VELLGAIEGVALNAPPVPELSPVLPKAIVVLSGDDWVHELTKLTEDAGTWVLPL